MKGQIRNGILLKAIGKHLRELREERGISQELVLFKTGIYLVRIEAGQLNITVSTLTGLCSFYGITLEEFFAGFDYE